MRSRHLGGMHAGTSSWGCEDTAPGRLRPRSKAHGSSLLLRQRARSSLELGQLPEGHLREVVVLAVVVRGDAQNVEPGAPIHAVRRPVLRRAADASTLIVDAVVRHEEGSCRERRHLPNGLRD